MDRASGANVADDLPLLDVAAAADALGKAVHVRVQRAVALAVLDHHCIAVATMATGECDATIAGSLDRSAAREQRNPRPCVRGSCSIRGGGGPWRSVS